MMKMRVPYQYTYTEYKDSPLATFCDKMLHNLQRIYPYAVFLAVALSIGAYSAYSMAVKYFPSLKKLPAIITVLVLVLALIFPVLMLIIWEKRNCGERLARWDIMRHQSQENRVLARRQARKMVLRILIPFLAFYILIPGTMILIGEATSSNRSEQMREAFSNGYSVATGRQLISYLEDKSEFSEAFIPERLLAKNPEDVGYILYISIEKSVQVGTVSDINMDKIEWVDVPVYGDRYLIKWFDCGKEEIVYEEYVTAKEVDKSTEKKDGAYYVELPPSSIVEEQIEKSYRNW